MFRNYVIPKPSHARRSNPALKLKTCIFVWVGPIACLLFMIRIAPRSLRAQTAAPPPEKGPTSLVAPAPATQVKAISENPLDPLASIESLIGQRQYQQAIPGLEHYLHDHDSSAKAHYDLGYVYFRNHKVGEAVRELSRSLELDDRDAQAHKILGLVCTFVGRYDLAETELQAAAQLDPKSAEIHYFLGRIYYTRQVFPMALKEFQTAIQLNPDYMKAYSNLGLVMDVLGKDDQAIQDYTTAVRMNEEQHSNSPWPFEYLSAHYNRERQPALAIEFARKALSMDSQCDLAYYDLAKAYQSQSGWQQAIDADQKAIAINSSTPEYFYLLSDVLRRLGRIRESEDALKRFQQIHDDQNATARIWRDAHHQPNLPQAAPAQDDEP